MKTQKEKPKEFISAEIFYQGLENKIVRGWKCKKHKCLIGENQECPLCKSDEALKKHRQEIKEKKMFVGTTSPQRRAEMLERDKKRTRKRNYEALKTKEGRARRKEAQKRQSFKRKARIYSHSL